MRTIVVLTLFIFSQAFAIVPTNAPMAKSVWISATNVTIKSTGSQKYPLDGSTSTKFDALHRSFPPYTIINYFSNYTYRTTGSASYNEINGWWVKPGWKIKGHGATVQQVFYPSVSGVKHGTFEMTMYDVGNCEISNLTIDENSQTFPSNSCTFAINLYGNKNVIRNVKVINGHGYLADLLESFSIAICARYGPNGWETSANNLIENCVVSDYQGNYGIAICMMLGAGGKVYKCAVTNFIGTAAFGLSSGVTYDNCVSVNCRGSYYTDTGMVSNSVLRNCTIIGGSGIQIHYNPVIDNPMVRNALIEGCNIDCPKDGIGIAMSGQLGPGYQYGFVIRKCIFKGKGAAIVAANVNGLTVEDNQAPAGMISYLNLPDYPSFNIISRRNKIVGAPLGLEDTPAL